MKPKITTKELVDIFKDFDAELELDEEKLTKLSDKEKSELYLAVQKVMEYREDFPPDLAQAVQDLAKQAAAKESIQKGDISKSLNPDDENGIVLESGEIIEPDDELFSLAKSLDKMSAKEVEKLVDDLAVVVAHYGNIELMKRQVKLLDKKLQIIEKKRGIKNSDADKGKKWPTISNQQK